MSTAWTKEKYEETLKQLYKKAATDEAFRKRCLKDAAGAIKEISGLDLPAGAKVRFVEKLEEQVFVLPNAAAGELSEEELATVAGGASTDSPCTYVVCGGVQAQPSYRGEIARGVPCGS